MARRHTKAVGAMDGRSSTRDIGSVGHTGEASQRSVAMSVAVAIDRLAERFLWIAQFVIIASILIVAYYAMDRDPPFVIVSVEPASARPGEIITIQSEVRRETWRNCSADFTRYIFGPDQSRFYLDDGIASAHMINRMDEKTPNKLRVSFLVPYGINPGPARLETVLEYHCNRVHRLWPIEVTTIMPFTVLQ